MKKLSLVFVLAAALLVPFMAGCDGTDALTRELDSIAETVEEMRELAPASDVPYSFMPRDDLKDYLLDDMEEQYPVEEAAIDKEIFVLLDLLGPSQDVREILADVLEEQVIGFYDDDTGQLNVVSSNEELSALDEVTFAHEYTHALQDQNYDFDNLDLESETNSDAAMAALCLIEGDAVLTQTNYMITELSPDQWMAIMEEVEGTESGQLENAPRFMQIDLLFPYGREYADGVYEGGLPFVTALFEANGWDTVNQAYIDPPKSTEQILHPEKYIEERDEPTMVEMPDLAVALGGTWTLQDSDVLGELYTRTYLENYLSRGAAQSAAEGWDGDSLVYLKNEAGEWLLVWRLTWDTTEDAEEFFEAYTAYVYDKYNGQWQSLVERSTSRQWATVERDVYLGLSGQDTLVVLSSEALITEQVLVELPRFKVSQPCP